MTEDLKKPNPEPNEEKDFGENFGESIDNSICPMCDGTGIHNGRVCKECDGKVYK